MTAARSPRVPDPLSANTAATRLMYAGLGLLVTNCLISRLAMNGPVFGWLKSVSSAIFKSPVGSGTVEAGIVVPRKVFSSVEWWFG